MLVIFQPGEKKIQAVGPAGRCPNCPNVIRDSKLEISHLLITRVSTLTSPRSRLSLHTHILSHSGSHQEQVRSCRHDQGLALLIGCLTRPGECVTAAPVMAPGLRGSTACSRRASGSPSPVALIKTCMAPSSLMWWHEVNVCTPAFATVSQPLCDRPT